MLNLLKDHAEALANVIKDKLSNSESKEDAENMLEKITSFNLHDIDVTIQNLTGKNIKTLMKEKGIPSKNAVEFKRSLLKDYMKTHLFRHRVKCPLCKRRNSKFRNDGHRAVLLDFGVGGIFGKKTMKGKLKKGDDADGDEDAMGLDDNGPIEEFLDKMEKEKAISADFLRNDSALTKQLEAIQSGKCTKLIWRGAEAREHFRMVWKHDGEVLQKLFPLFEIFLKDNSCPMDKLFYELLIVPPNKFRPIRVFKGDRFEDPQTVGFRRIMEINQLITYVKSSINESGYTVGDADIRTAIEAKLGKGTLVEKLHRAYLDLQLKVNSLYDSELNKMEPRPIPGIRQLLEKKQGLFRMHMMGKRVDYACRSVITPDPYLDVDEIGIPEIFAKKLTFGEIPNLLNLQELRQAVINGPEKYPGASFVRLINGRKEAIHPEDHFADDRRGKSRRLQVPTDSLPNEGIKSKEDGTGIKTVIFYIWLSLL
uniref:DNA-directed RNA polymerase n=1 Tax=Panagrolaimus sp. PS1159 TaxID=55785 RepID=A0AC35G840_9BILA